LIQIFFIYIFFQFYTLILNYLIIKLFNLLFPCYKIAFHAVVDCQISTGRILRFPKPKPLIKNNSEELEVAKPSWISLLLYQKNQSYPLHGHFLASPINARPIQKYTLTVSSHANTRIDALNYSPCSGF